MKRLATMLLASAALGLGACGNQAADGPPAVRLGHDVCAECNMIISDGRWATATVIQGPRGPEPRLFDDFNCQVNFENEHADTEIVARWSHDHASAVWLRTESAHFLLTRDLRTPMGSNAAAFAGRTDAEAAAAALAAQRAEGQDSATAVEIVPFATAWKRLGAKTP
ncbi:MAG TPA: nitrous oxide reductase accessory protein NosL [Phycisphaerales bacterium]|nr:nitrous oxide reductase accessory protein NosL [Phycisphaerales bacterium]